MIQFPSYNDLEIHFLALLVFVVTNEVLKMVKCFAYSDLICILAADTQRLKYKSFCLVVHATQDKRTHLERRLSAVPQMYLIGDGKFEVSREPVLQETSLQSLQNTVDDFEILEKVLEKTFVLNAFVITESSFFRIMFHYFEIPSYI